MTTMSIDEQMRQMITPTPSELEYNETKLDIFLFCANRYHALFPQKWRIEGVKILRGSKCFRDWVIMVIENNNVLLLDLLPKIKCQTSDKSWYEWQIMYIEERQLFPPKIIIQAAINEWLHKQNNRVSEVVNPI